MQFLLRAENIQDVLTVQDRLNATRAEIEQVQGRINLVEHQTDLATITVHLTRRSSPGRIRRRPVRVARSRSPPIRSRRRLKCCSVLATVVLAVLAFSWWIVPLALIAAFIARRQLRSGSARDGAPSVAADFGRMRR